MAVSAALSHELKDIRLPVPPPYVRHLKRRLLRNQSLRLVVMALCLLLMGRYLSGDVAGVISLLVLPGQLLGMVLHPFLWSSCDSWVYVANDDGVFAQDENSPVRLPRYPLMSGKREMLAGIAPRSWQGWPGLGLVYSRKFGRARKTSLMIFRAEDEELVAQTLIPRLMARLPEAA